MSRYLIFFNFFRQYSSKKCDTGQAPKWEGCLTWPQVVSREHSLLYFLEISGSPPLVSPGVVEVVRSITCRALLPAFPCLEHSPLLCTLARACRSLRCFRSLRPGTHASSLSLGSLVLHNENMPHLLDLHQTSPLAETLLDSPFLFSFRMVSPSSFTIKEGFRS